MKHEETIRIRVVHWPRFERTTEFTLDRRLFPEEQSLARYVRRRFGEGALQHLDEHTWEYVRDIPGPSWWWKLLATVLNKSYI